MSKSYTITQAFTDQPRPAIALTPVESSQITAIGYDAQANTLAVRFSRGSGAIYHYPDISPEQHAAFIGAKSIGSHFGQHIKPLSFIKFAAEPAHDDEDSLAKAD
jgi:hypothetical protein